MIDSLPKHVLIVDEDRDSRAALAGHLERHAYRVTTASTGLGLQRALERTRIDLIVLDLNGDDDGLRVCRSLLATSDVPVVITTRRADDVDRIVGLEMGADDFLVKPLNFREMVARIRNILRRAGGGAREPGTPRNRLYRFGGWQLDIVARELSDPQGKTTALRSSEYRVLASLLAHGNRVVSRGRLIELARGRDADPFDRSIDVRISRLRQILGDDARGPRIIKTVHGEGYVIGVLVERG
ncbi:MAG TPA: response regulator [Steroidobacteraceae bacterium]|nr:response regulator [Steroidobacteraceae bacterium]